jgi:hypothetical protein
MRASDFLPSRFASKAASSSSLCVCLETVSHAAALCGDLIIKSTLRSTSGMPVYFSHVCLNETDNRLQDALQLKTGEDSEGQR